MYNCLALIGLSIDVLGASILSIPDVPFVRNLFRFGRIREGKKKIISGGLELDDVGHSEIVEIYDDVQNNYGFTESSVKEIKIASISRPVIEGSEIVDRQPQRTIQADIDPEEVNGDSQITEHQDTNFRLLDQIDSQIESGERKLRIICIGLIII